MMLFSRDEFLREPKMEWSGVTQLLRAWSDRDPGAMEQLVPWVTRSCNGWRDATWLMSARRECVRLPDMLH
jgi:hypothetical protein